MSFRCKYLFQIRCVALFPGFLLLFVWLFSPKQKPHFIQIHVDKNSSILNIKFIEFYREMASEESGSKSRPLHIMVVAAILCAPVLNRINNSQIIVRNMLNRHKVAGQQGTDMKIGKLVRHTNHKQSTISLS